MSAQGSGIAGWRNLAYLFGNSAVDEVAEPRNQSKMFVVVSIVILGAAVLAAGAGGLLRAHKCRVISQLRPLSGNVEARMVVRSGHACAVHSGATQAIGKFVYLTTSPHHGVVRKRGTTGLIYRPDPRFRGDDFFSYVAHAKSSADSAITWVQVHVRVQ